MNYKAVVPKPISIRIGQFRLDRNLLVRLVAAIHERFPRGYERSRHFRVPGNEETYKERIILLDETAKHLFRFAVDDTTAQGFLIVEDIHYQKMDRPPHA